MLPEASVAVSRSEDRRQRLELGALGNGEAETEATPQPGRRLTQSRI